MTKIYKKFAGWNAGKVMKAAALLLGLSAFNLNAQYCASSPSQPWDEEIYDVMVNGAVTNPLYSYANGCSTPAPGAGSILNRYSNFKSLGSSFTATQGAVSTFSVREDECDGATYYSNGIGIWIDYNQDGDFLDAGEAIFIEPNTNTGPRTVTGTFIAPFSAPPAQQ